MVSLIEPKCSRYSTIRLFKDLTEEEREVIWKGISLTTEILQEYISHVSKAIRREIASNVTYYDLYNKLKHGFAPIYPYVIPVSFSITGAPIEANNEELIDGRHNDYA